MHTEAIKDTVDPRLRFYSRTVQSDLNQIQIESARLIPCIIRESSYVYGFVVGKGRGRFDGTKADWSD